MNRIQRQSAWFRILFGCAVIVFSFVLGLAIARSGAVFPALYSQIAIVVLSLAAIVWAVLRLRSLERSSMLKEANLKLENIRVLFEPRDLWVGLFWKVEPQVGVNKLFLYICLLPCVPIRIIFSASRGQLVCRALGHNFTHYSYQKQEGYSRCSRCGSLHYF